MKKTLITLLSITLLASIFAFAQSVQAVLTTTPWRYDTVLQAIYPYPTAVQKVGIGTTSPTYKLSVEGISSLGNQAIVGYITATSTANTATSTFAGNVAIGPLLDINAKLACNSGGGNDYCGYFYIIGNGKTGLSSIAEGDDTTAIYGEGATAGSFRGGVTGLYSYVSNASGYAVHAKQNNASGYSVYAEGGKNYFEGNVGVATTSPYARLSVKGSTATDKKDFVMTDSTDTEVFSVTNVGNINVANTGTFGGSVNSGVSGGYAILGTDVIGGDAGVFVQSGSNTYSLASRVNNRFIYGHDDTDYSGGITIDGNVGKVGVGTSTPWGLLSVNHVASTTALYPSFVVGSSTATHFIVADGGNVGIGTTSPYAKLSVVGPVVAEYFHATSTTATTTLAGGLSAGGGSGLKVLQNGKVGVGGAFSGAYAFETAGTGKFTDQLNVFNLVLDEMAGGGTTCLEAANTGGVVRAAGPCAISGADYPFPLTGNATSTLTQFNGGLTAFASSTIGSGTQIGGLTISGGATTTGNMYVAGNMMVGTTTNSDNAKLNIDFSNVSGGSGLVIRQAATNILFDKTNAPIKIYNPSGVLSASIRGDGLISGRFLSDNDDQITLSGSTDPQGYIGIDMRDSARIAWTNSSSWYGTKVLDIRKDSNHRLAVSMGATFGGNTGIGTTSPLATLSVNSANALTQSPLFYVASSSSAVSTSTYFMIDALGKVAIGTSTLGSAKLTLTSTSATDAAFLVNGLSSGTGNDPSGVGFFLTNNQSGNRQFVIADSVTKLGVRYLNAAVDGYNNGSRADLKIGTETNGFFSGFQVSNSFVSISNRSGSIQSKAVLDIQGASVSSDTTPQTGPLIASELFGETQGTRFMLTGNGKLGVGTTSPWASLSVSTSTQSTGNLVLFAVASSSNATLFNVLGNGNVGLGTTSPGTALSIGNISGINFVPTATSTFGSGGIDLKAGCFSINGTCISGGAAGTSPTTAVFEDQKSAGTNGGTNATGQNIRTLNTTVINNISGASLASNQVTLPAGTYTVHACTIGSAVDLHKSYWFNVTDSATTTMGRAGYSDSVTGLPLNSESCLDGSFTIAGSKVYELRWYSQTGGVINIGLGSATSFGTEVYSNVTITKQ